MNTEVIPVTRTPVECETGFAASHLTQIAHRVKRAESVTVRGRTYLHGQWLCGSESGNAFVVEDPALFGGVCERCDDIFLADPVVYRCWSATDCLLYIGSCMRWPNREALHETQSPWWPEVARVDTEPQPNFGTAKRVERAAIRAEAPLYNKVHNVQRFRRDGNSFVPVTAAA